MLLYKYLKVILATGIKAVGNRIGEGECYEGQSMSNTNYYILFREDHLIDKKDTLAEIRKAGFVRLDPGEKGVIYKIQNNKVAGIADYDKDRNVLSAFREPEHMIYFLGQYEFHPETGTVYSHVNARERREIGRHKKRLILDLGGKNRKNVKKTRFFYSLVNGRPSRHFVVETKNGDETDASMDNLICVSRVEYFTKYDWTKKAVLSDSQVQKMRKMYHSGTSRKDLARLFQVSQGTVRNVVVGDNHYANR